MPKLDLTDEEFKRQYPAAVARDEVAELVPNVGVSPGGSGQIKEDQQDSVGVPGFQEFAHPIPGLRPKEEKLPLKPDIGRNISREVLHDLAKPFNFDDGTRHTDKLICVLKEQGLYLDRSGQFVYIHRSTAASVTNAEKLPDRDNVIDGIVRAMEREDKAQSKSLARRSFNLRQMKRSIERDKL